jgi:hypothetical protein
VWLGAAVAVALICAAAYWASVIRDNSNCDAVEGMLQPDLTPLPVPTLPFGTFVAETTFVVYATTIEC